MTLPFIVTLFSSIISAEIVTQDSWLFGPGLQGSVGNVWLWCRSYYTDSDAMIVNDGDDVALQKLAKRIVDTDFAGASCVFAEDVDGDNDIDILGVSGSNEEIAWWENLDGVGNSWQKHIIENDFGNYINSVLSIDINGNGISDVLVAEHATGITWFENSDGTGLNWIERNIDDVGSTLICTGDMNGDGTIDIVGIPYMSDFISWWENVDGSGTLWTEHLVDSNIICASSISADDLDSDGDIDVIGTSSMLDEIIWWENTDGSGISWAKHEIDTDFDNADCVRSVDVDGDGDIDVFCSGFDGLFWWENLNGIGTSWNIHTVESGSAFRYSKCFSISDLDGDDDFDLVAVLPYSNDLAWWENTDGSGISWIRNDIDQSLWGASSSFCADIDGDGNTDVIACGHQFGGYTSWWNLMTIGYVPEGWLESAILYLNCDPEWGSIEWNSTEPPATTVAFQVRASDDPNEMGIWSDTLFSPCNLQEILNDYNSHFQYRVFLLTSNQDTTPTLENVSISWNSLGVQEENQTERLRLLSIRPNPSFNAPSIEFSLLEQAVVSLSVYNISGRLEEKTTPLEYSSGYHSITLEDLSPGIYFCRLTSEYSKITKRFAVIY